MAGAKAGRPRPALIVAGMHRSGTSAMARVLSLAGASLPKRVIEAAPDNPAGYWEPADMVALSDRILEAVGSRWDDPLAIQAARRAAGLASSFRETADQLIRDDLGERPLPVLKDPRVSVLIPFWQAALQAAGLDPAYVIMVRNPLEVAGSLHARDGFAVQKSLRVWTAYMLAAERDTRGRQRVFVCYDDLLRGPLGVLDRVEAMGLSLPRRAEAGDDIAAFLDASLRHHRASPDQIAAQEDDGLAPDAVYRWMSTAAAGQEPPPHDLIEAAAGFEDLDRRAGPLIQALHRELGDAPRLRFRLRETEEEIEALRALCNRFHGEVERGRVLAEEATMRLAAAERQAQAISRQTALRGDGRALEEARGAASEAHLQLIRERARVLETAEVEAQARARLSARFDEQLEATLAGERLERAALLEALEDARRESDQQLVRLAKTEERARSAADRLMKTERALTRASERGDAAIRDLEEATRALDETRRRLEQASHELEAARQEAERLRQRKDELLRSASWRLTRPVRVVARRLAHGARGGS